jgi:hypothetical protein
MIGLKRPRLTWCLMRNGMLALLYAYSTVYPALQRDTQAMLTRALLRAFKNVGTLFRALYTLSHDLLSTGGHFRLAAPPLFVPLASIRPNTPCVNLRKHAIH